MIIDPLSDVLKEGSFRNSSKNHLCQSGCLELYVTLGLGRKFNCTQDKIGQYRESSGKIREAI